MNDKLKVLDAMLISEESGCVAVKRNVRIYQKNKIYVIKPNQSRYWSYSAACKDADEIYADIMATWRKIMSSIKNISASNPVPNDLAKRLGMMG